MSKEEHWVESYGELGRHYCMITEQLVDKVLHPRFGSLGLHDRFDLGGEQGS